MRRAMLGWGVVLGLGCASTGERADPDEQSDAAEVVAGAASVLGVAPKRSAVAAPGLRLPPGTHYAVQTMNFTIVVDSPERALDKARDLVAELGGEVTHASTHDTGGTLNAVLPAGTPSKAVRAPLHALARRVQDENIGRSDYGSAIRESQRRQARIEIARAQLAQVMRTTDDAEVADALALLFEITETERRNVESQLFNYAEQTRGSQLYINFVEEGAVPAPAIEG